MDLKTFYGLTGLRDAEVLCVYLVVSTLLHKLDTKGSRLFGVHRPDSDYDLKVVVSNNYSGGEHANSVINNLRANFLSFCG